MPPLPPDLLTRELAGIDIYLLDQILKGRIGPEQRILDAGCGAGRNVAYLLSLSSRVCGIDESPGAIDQLRQLAAQRCPTASAEQFRIEPIESSSFADASFDVVIANAVLHFARDAEHFQAMLSSLWRMLAPTGLLFARLAASDGLEARLDPLGHGRYRLPDGSARFLVDTPELLRLTEQLKAELLEPIKSVNVQGLRCMTTWVLRKKPGC